MAATYSYGGEFSSDEDIDRMEQNLAQSKFDTYAQLKPTKRQIEEAIEAIKQMPVDQEVSLTDEILAGLLDYYKTQRGPIVDSTRNLYRNIVLKLIRNDDKQALNGNSATNDSNGKSADNNNDIHIISKKPVQTAEVASSDEDEPMPPASQSSVRKLDARVGSQSSADQAQPMEIDSDAQVEIDIRGSKPVEVSSSEDESSSEESIDKSDSDATQGKRNHPRVTSTPKAAKVTESTKKVAAGVKTPLVESKRKPYTRSQKVAATRASPASKSADVSSSKTDASVSEAGKPLSKAVVSSKLNLKYFVVALLVAAVAFLLYYFRSDLNKTTDRILSKAKLNF